MTQYKSPVDGSALLEIKDDGVLTGYRDASTGVEYSIEYVKDAADKTRVQIKPVKAEKTDEEKAADKEAKDLAKAEKELKAKEAKAKELADKEAAAKAGSDQTK